METENQIEPHVTPPRRRSSLARKLGIAIVGVTVILIGIPLIPLIGPGWLIVFTGLAILATEFEWARRLRDRVRSRFRDFMGNQDRA
jgi:uncharacterized protein (TIGR02611 family)